MNPHWSMTHRKDEKRKRKGSRTVSILTEPEKKLYRISFFKRRRLGDNTAVPFGYKYGVGEIRVITLTTLE